MSQASVELPTETELAAIKRGMSLVLVGAVLSPLAEVVFTAAQYFLSNPAAHDAPRLRPPNVPDPDFAYLLPILMVVLLAALIEAGGKIMSLSRPERWRYGWLHAALAFDFVHVFAVMLRFFNYGRSEGPLVAVIEVLQLAALGSPAALAVFIAQLARRFDRRRLVVLARVCFVSTLSVVVLNLPLDLLADRFDAEAIDLRNLDAAGAGYAMFVVVAGVVALVSWATDIAMLVKVHGLTPPPSSAAAGA